MPGNRQNQSLGRWFEPRAGGTRLQVIRDKFNFDKADDEARLAVINEIQALSDSARQLVAGGTPLADFDTDLQLEEWQIRDRLDYYDLYSNRQETITVRDGAWFTPDAVESFCGESGTDVVGQSIDGLNNTIWRHTVNERHNVIYRLRDYPKKISKIRFRYANNEPDRERLTSLDVHASKNLNRIDDVESILEQGINISWPVGAGNTWVEHVLAQKKANARYIKLSFTTDDPNNVMAIREFAVWVETRQVNDLF